MTLTVGTSSGNKDASSITVGTSIGNKAVQEGWVGTSSGNKLFFSALSAGISPGAAIWLDNGSSYTSTPDFTATPNGGVGPYTYSWEATGDGVPISQGAASTQFDSPTAAAQNVRCLVTDNNGSTAYTPYAGIS